MVPSYARFRKSHSLVLLMANGTYCVGETVVSEMSRSEECEIQNCSCPIWLGLVVLHCGPPPSRLRAWPTPSSVDASTAHLPLWQAGSGLRAPSPDEDGDKKVPLRSASTAETMFDLVDSSSCPETTATVPVLVASVERVDGSRSRFFLGFSSSYQTRHRIMP